MKTAFVAVWLQMAGFTVLSNPTAISSAHRAPAHLAAVAVAALQAMNSAA